MIVDMGTTVATLINDLYSLKCVQSSDSEVVKRSDDCRHDVCLSCMRLHCLSLILYGGY